MSRQKRLESLAIAYYLLALWGVTARILSLHGWLTGEIRDNSGEMVGWVAGPDEAGGS